MFVCLVVIRNSVSPCVVYYTLLKETAYWRGLMRSNFKTIESSLAQPRYVTCLYLCDLFNGYVNI